MPHQAPKVLLIGAGAVGQVYGRHLELGGAKVTFYVREKYLQGLEAGMPVYPLNKQSVTDAPIMFEAYKLISTIEEVHQG